jgi:hypothetical protein
MKIDDEKRIRYGGGWVRERKDWQVKHPLGPVHWDVWDGEKELLAEDVSASELQGFMVAKGLLVLW